MIDHTLEKMEARVRERGTLPDDVRRELLGLIAELRGELSTLPSERTDDAESISGFAAASAREALRASRDPRLVELSVEGLSHSVRELETSHPRLVKVANSICHMLSNLGI